MSGPNFRTITVAQFDDLEVNDYIGLATIAADGQSDIDHFGRIMAITDDKQIVLQPTTRDGQNELDGNVVVFRDTMLPIPPKLHENGSTGVVVLRVQLNNTATS